MWIEDHWDHRFLVWEDDPLANILKDLDPKVVIVPFNPTAEHLAIYLVEKVGVEQLLGTGVTLVEVTIEETAKCHATYAI